MGQPSAQCPYKAWRGQRLILAPKAAGSRGPGGQITQPHPLHASGPEQSPGLTLSPFKNSPLVTLIILQWVASPIPSPGFYCPNLGDSCPSGHTAWVSLGKAVRTQSSHWLLLPQVTLALDEVPTCHPGSNPGLSCVTPGLWDTEGVLRPLLCDPGVTWSISLPTPWGMGCFPRQQLRLGFMYLDPSSLGRTADRRAEKW